MRREKAVIATTRLDRHRDKFTREALEAAAEEMSSVYLPMVFNHDPRIAPLGRAVEAEVQELPDGEYGLVVTQEVFEPGDELSDLTGEREMAMRRLEHERFTVVCDRSYSAPEDAAILNELAEAGIKVEREEKKALEPISVLLLGVGVAASAFAAGFLNKMGADTWDCLRPRLRKLLSRRREERREYLFILELQVEREDNVLSIQVILSDPDEEELSAFFTAGVSLLARSVPSVVKLDERIRRVVLHWKNGALEPGFAVRSDCVPLPLRQSPSSAE